MTFQPSLVEITSRDSGTPVLSRGPKGSAGVIVNVGGTTVDGKVLAGPDTALLTAGQGTGTPNVFVLLAGAALAFPAEIGPIYARAANTTTTLSTAVGFSP